ncbi:HSP20-like chaperone [Hypoxylon trugodes]|uniref:HSP20-like chaperone n=1 Tax=Hypoxylon trugodes TaxID=326681 RepID=UPI002193862B|nr:HSP20-like chaperone [Hypoxylon trugodes]KAI1390215.1 HSP20-like chaperone [Hypoxylon trugodes]
MANPHNNNNNNQQAPFWEFLQSFGPAGGMRAGVGIDHANLGSQFPHGFNPFDPTQMNANNPWLHGWGNGWGRGAGAWGPHGWPNRDSFQRYRDVPESGREDEQGEHETEGSPDTMRHTPDAESFDDEDYPDHPPHAPGSFPHPHPPPPTGEYPHPPPPPPGAPNHPRHPGFHRGHPHHFGGHRGRGGRFGHGGRFGRNPPPAYSGPWDFRPLMHAFSTHPFAQAFRDYMDRTRNDPTGESFENHEEAFVPPVDTFNTEKAYVLHVSLPGALKEDIAVNWDGEKVIISGVVHRPGNEVFIQSLISSERKVGMFKRNVRLPPPGSNDKEDVDGLGITAKMENGILIVTVPKSEKEWTEIHKVDIE